MVRTKLVEEDVKECVNRWHESNGEGMIRKGRGVEKCRKEKFNRIGGGGTQNAGGWNCCNRKQRRNG